jgi:hypothetical protein
VERYEDFQLIQLVSAALANNEAGKRTISSLIIKKIYFSEQPNLPQNITVQYTGDFP